MAGRADLVLSFLRQNRADSYLLVGDILELAHPRLIHWTEAHQAVIDHLARRAREGAQLVYLVGNHDPDPARAHWKRRLSVEPVREHIHTGADGARSLVLHGDVADRRLLRYHAVTRLGSRLDHALRRLDGWLSVLRRQTRNDTRTAIEWMMESVNTMLYRSREHERRMVDLARARNLDGVICGHFHIADLHRDHGLIYANCGDWVDSFTALAEGHDGRLSLLCGHPAPVTTPMPVPAMARLAKG